MNLATTHAELYKAGSEQSVVNRNAFQDKDFLWKGHAASPLATADGSNPQLVRLSVYGSFRNDSGTFLFAFAAAAAEAVNPGAGEPRRLLIQFRASVLRSSPDVDTVFGLPGRVFSVDPLAPRVATNDQMSAYVKVHEETANGRPLPMAWVDLWMALRAGH